jgi:hypothetical protein
VYLDNVGGTNCQHSFAHVSGLSGVKRALVSVKRDLVDNVGGTNCQHSFAHVSGLSGILSPKSIFFIFWGKRTSVCVSVGYLPGIFKSKSPKYTNSEKKKN